MRVIACLLVVAAALSQSAPMMTRASAWVEANQKAVISGTAVVLIACIIVGAFLWLNDEVWKYVVQHVLLR